MGFAMVITLWGVALFFLLGGIAGLFEGNIGMAIGCIPIGVGLYYLGKQLKQAPKEKEDFYNFCGGKDKLKYENYTGFIFPRAIALDVNTQTLFLKFAKIQKAYPFTAIRNWESGIEHSNRGATPLTNEERKQTPYLTINVKDIDYPEWKMTGIPNQRWFEILNQEINES